LTNSINGSNNFNGPAAIADFNGDGKLDLATLNGVDDGTVSILLQQ
jgi:FG-GAP repeat